MPDEASKKVYTAEDITKLYKRGCFTNGLPWLIMYPLIKYMDLGLYVGIAAGIQYAVYILHGLPYSSEKFYDLSGSVTHFSVVVAALVMNESKRSPRQIMVAVAAIVWMTRLGSFLYLRIVKDGRDERFDHLKKTWLSFLGAWTF